MFFPGGGGKNFEVGGRRATLEDEGWAHNPANNRDNDEDSNYISGG